MQKGIITLAVILAVASLLIGIKVNIQETGIPRLEMQISMLAESQREVLEKLTAIEKAQQTLKTEIAGIRRLPGGQPPTAARPPAPPPEDPNKVYDIPVAQSPVKGKADAPVTIVEFSDFQCPFSQRFHAVIPEVLRQFPDKVNYVLKNFPLSFHPQAMPAAKAALAAGEQGKYWEMVEALFNSGRDLSPATYIELAGKLGLDVEKFKQDLQEKDAEYEQIIKADMELGRKVNVRGTPTFYINGKKTGARDVNSYKQAIEAILDQEG